MARRLRRVGGRASAAPTHGAAMTPAATCLRKSRRVFLIENCLIDAPRVAANCFPPVFIFLYFKVVPAGDKDGMSTFSETSPAAYRFCQRFHSNPGRSTRNCTKR